MVTLLHDEMLFLAKHYAQTRSRAIAAIDEATESIDDKHALAIASDAKRKLSDMTDEVFEMLAVEEWADKNGIDIIWARDNAVEAVRNF